MTSHVSLFDLYGLSRFQDGFAKTIPGGISMLWKDEKEKLASLRSVRIPCGYGVTFTNNSFKALTGEATGRRMSPERGLHCSAPGHKPSRVQWAPQGLSYPITNPAYRICKIGFCVGVSPGLGKVLAFFKLSHRLSKTVPTVQRLPGWAGIEASLALASVSKNLASEKKHCIPAHSIFRARSEDTRVLPCFLFLFLFIVFLKHFST